MTQWDKGFAAGKEHSIAEAKIKIKAECDAVLADKIKQLQAAREGDAQRNQNPAVALFFALVDGMVARGLDVREACEIAGRAQ